MSTQTWTTQWSWTKYIDYVRKGFLTWLFAWVVGLHGIIVFLPSTFFAFLLLGPDVPGAWNHGFTIALYSLVASTICLLLTESKWSWSQELFGTMIPAGFMIGMVIELILSLIWGALRVGAIIFGTNQIGSPQFNFSVVFSIVVIVLAFIWGLSEAVRK